jgi:cysteine-rich repeat protein
LQATGEHLTGLRCGDGVVQWGDVTTASGTFRGFETCDDGNQVAGDGCSEFCQREPVAASGQLSRASGNLCAIRADKSLSCWGAIATGAPTGSFAQVSLATYYACALRSDGTVVCWLPDGLLGAFQPANTYRSISGDSSQICGVRSDGGLACWNDHAATFAQDGDFARVATGGRVCGLSAAGAATCWDPYPDFPTGPFLQVFPDGYGGCGLGLNGALSCLSNTSFFVSSAPDAALRSAYLAFTSGVGLRPDGRVVAWHLADVTLPGQDRAYAEVVTDCGLTAEHDVHCWSGTPAFPQ